MLNNKLSKNQSHRQNRATGSKIIKIIIKKPNITTNCTPSWLLIIKSL